MPNRIVGRAVGPWEIRGARYVLGHDEHVIGAIDVAGLEGALEAIERLKAGRRAEFDNLSVEGLDDKVRAWFQSWGSDASQGAHHMRDIVIRDHSGDRWFYVYGAFFRRFRASDDHVLVVNRIELGDAPDWAP